MSKTLQEVAEYYDTHCTVCRLAFIDGDCPKDCPAALEGNQRWHGTAGGYSNHKCRGPLCRRAWADYTQDLRKRRALRPASKIPHGVNGYRNYGCRCGICRTGQSKSRRKKSADGD